MNEENNQDISRIRKEMDKLEGVSFDDVKVHYSHKMQIESSVYSQGTDIYVGPAQEKYISHELGHVIQQKKGKVSVTDFNGINKELGSV